MCQINGFHSVNITSRRLHAYVKTQRENVTSRLPPYFGNLKKCLNHVWPLWAFALGNSVEMQTNEMWILRV